MLSLIVASVEDAIIFKDNHSYHFYYVQYMQQLLRLLLLLSGNKRYTLHELHKRFDVSERTIYRYLDTIEDAGFVLNRMNGSYNLQLETTQARSLQKLLHFSEEEAYILYKTLSLIGGTSALKARLVCKLNAMYDFRALSQVEDKSHLETIRRLSEAIGAKKQVLLKGYRSSNSDSIHDRTVEPFEFLPDYKATWCYDKQSSICKQFKIARMKDVGLLPTSWQKEEKHKVPFVDAFHMSAEAPIATIQAHLSLKAYNLLIEEFPLAETYVEPLNGKYLLAIPVADFNGIGRFVMGLLGDVKMLE
ncbi:MAG: helix-turn-helix transcriptional regulator, partial [Segetibacter sp.]